MKLNFITPFITLPGLVDEALDLYSKAFPDSEIIEITRFNDAGFGELGKVMNALLRIRDTHLMFMDMSKEQSPVPSWNICLYVNLESEEEFDIAFKNLSEIGEVMMGPEPIFELRKVAWLTDKFGITWQLVWA